MENISGHAVTVERIEFFIRNVSEEKFTAGKPPEPEVNPRRPRGAVIDTIKAGLYVPVVFLRSTPGSMVRRTYQLSWLEHVNGHAEHTAFRVWGNFVISLPDGRS